VHELLRDDPDVRRALVDRFGADVIGDDGADRTAIARLVFNDPEQLEWLERLLHPRVVQEQSKWQRELAAGPDPPLVTVTEVPLLYETGGEQRFDRVVVVTAAPEIRAARRPVDDERERRLIPDAEKVRLADYSFVNDGSPEELDAFVAEVMARLTA
jgi:dephospho-CoA kinase